MAQPTAYDLQQASLYAENRMRLVFVKYISEKLPQIASHFDVSVTQASTDDYYYPASFKPRAVLVDVKITKDACDMLECVPWTETGPCELTTPATNVRIGDTGQIITACKPACFNLKEETTYTDGAAVPHIPQLYWNERDEACQIASTTEIWMNFPLIRSVDRFTARLNNFTEGFNSVPSNLTISGKEYQYTADYCGMFGDGLGSDGNCEEPLWKWFLDAIVGSSFALTLASAVGEAIGSDPLMPDSRAPIPPVDDKWTLKAWQNNINKSFVTPDPNMSLPADAEPQVKVGYFTKKTLIDLVDKGKITPEQRRTLEDQAEHLANPETRKLDAMSIASILALIGAAGYGAYTGQIGEMLIAIVSDPKTYAGLSDSILFAVLQKITKKLGSVFEKLAGNVGEKLGVKLTEGIVKVATTSLVKNTFSKLAFKTISKIMTKLTEVIAKIESVVGIILLLTTFFDILLSFWDPLGFNNQFPKGYLKDLQSNFDFALLNSIGVTSPTLTFDIFCSLLLTKDEILELSINQFEYLYEYLDALVVNSEGSRIDKGPEIVIDGGNQDDQDLANANQIKLYTQNELYNFEKDHLVRLKNIKTYKILGTTLLATGALLYIVKFEFLAMLLFLLCIVVTLLGYFSSSLDFIFDYDISPVYTYIENEFKTISRYFT